VHRIVIVALMLAPAGCGRLGFDSEGDAAGGDAPDAGGILDPDADATGAMCAEERLLSTYSSTAGGSHVGSFPAASILLRTASLDHVIGEAIPLMNGELGITEFRFEDDPEFAAVVASLTDAVPDNLYVGYRLQPDGPGSATPHGDAALASTRVTMFRRDVRLLEIAPTRMSTWTDLTMDTTWEVWGCTLP
jgi:hypothetical protein